MNGAQGDGACGEWSARSARRTLAEEFAELRRIMDEEDYRLTLVARSTRPNALIETLVQDGPDQ